MCMCVCVCVLGSEIVRSSLLNPPCTRRYCNVIPSSTTATVVNKGSGAVACNPAQLVSLALVQPLSQAGLNNGQSWLHTLSLSLRGILGTRLLPFPFLILIPFPFLILILILSFSLNGDPWQGSTCVCPRCSSQT